MVSPLKLGGVEVLSKGRETFTLKEIGQLQLPNYHDENILDDKLRFVFERKDGKRLGRLTSVSLNWKKSGLVAFAKQLSTDFTMELCRDPEKAWKFLMGLVGKKFIIQHQPTSDGMNNEITAIMPADQESTGEADHIPTVDLSHDDEDNIPF